MFLNQTLLNSCEEFFDEIANDENNLELSRAVDHLRSFLEQDIDGYTVSTNEDLALSVQDQLEDIWRMISRKEKNINPDLELIYQDVLAITEAESDYESEVDKECECDDELDCDFED